MYKTVKGVICILLLLKNIYIYLVWSIDKGGSFDAPDIVSRVYEQWMRAAQLSHKTQIVSEASTQ